MISDDSIVYDSNLILGPRTPLWPLPIFFARLRNPRTKSSITKSLGPDKTLNIPKVDLGWVVEQYPW